MASTNGLTFHLDAVIECYKKLPLLTQLEALVFVKEKGSFGAAAIDGRQPCSR